MINGIKYYSLYKKKEHRKDINHLEEVLIRLLIFKRFYGIFKVEYRLKENESFIRVKEKEFYQYNTGLTIFIRSKRGVINSLKQNWNLILVIGIAFKLERV